MKTSSENRDAFHTTRFTNGEALEVTEDAEACGISVSALIRLRVLNQAPPKAVVPAINRDAYLMLGKTGVNLNQLTHQFNLAVKTGDAPPEAAKVLSQLAEVLDAVKSVRLQLLGAER